MNTKSITAKSNTFLMHISTYALSSSNSFFCLLASLSLSFLHPLTLTPFLPLLGALSLSLCKRLKGLGLAMALFSNFFFFISSWSELEGAFLWQMGLMSTLGLSYFIAFLDLPEEEKELLCASSESHPFGHNQIQKESSEGIYGADLQTWERQKEALEEELKKWKEEASQRRIEMESAQERILVLQNEIEQICHEKESAAQSLMENSEKRIFNLQREIEGLLKEKEEAHQRLLLLKNHETQNLMLSKELEVAFREKEELIRHSEELKAECIQLQESSREKPQQSHNLAAVELNGEGCDSSPNFTFLKGQYNQLKQQFEEKSQLLSQTRTELFKAQTALWVFEREAKEHLLDIDLSEVVALQQELKTLTVEKEELEREITLLEELVSRALLQ